MFLPALLFLCLVEMPPLFAGVPLASVPPGEKTVMENPVDAAVLRLAGTFEEESERRELLSDLAVSQSNAGRLDAALRTAAKIEPIRDRKTLLRRLAFQHSKRSPWRHPNLDGVVAIISELVELDASQSGLAGEIAIDRLPRVVNGFSDISSSDGDVAEILRLVARFESPFESNRRAYDYVVALAETGLLEEAEKAIAKIDSDAFQDWAKLAILKFTVYRDEQHKKKNDKTDKELEQENARAFEQAFEHVLEQAMLFGTPEKRAWALLSILRERWQLERLDGMRVMSKNAERLFWCLTPWEEKTLQRIADEIALIETPEDRCIQQRILAGEYLENVDAIRYRVLTQKSLWEPAVYDEYKAACDDLLEKSVRLLQASETSAAEVQPLGRRLELLTFLAKVWRVRLPERNRHGEIIDSVRKALVGADRKTLTVAERVRVLESIAQALGDPVSPEMIEQAGTHPNAARMIGEILLREANLRDEPRAEPTDDPEIDRLQLPFDVFEEHYYSPFAVEGDCGC